MMVSVRGGNSRAWQVLKMSVQTLLLSSMLLPHGVWAGDADLTEEGLDLNDTHTVKTYYRELPDSPVGQVVAVAVIDAPLDLTWQTVVDYNNLGRGSHTLRLEKVQPLSDQLTQVSLLVDLPWPLKNMTCTLEFTQDPQRREMQWRNIAGCIRKNRGLITLQRAGEKTLLKMVVSIELGNILPQWLVNWAMKQKLPDEINLIRQSVELRRSDFARKGAG
jgi:uncharacterized membrane protein